MFLGNSVQVGIEAMFKKQVDKMKSSCCKMPGFGHTNNEKVLAHLEVVGWGRMKLKADLACRKVPILQIHGGHERDFAYHKKIEFNRYHILSTRTKSYTRKEKQSLISMGIYVLLNAWGIELNVSLHSLYFSFSLLFFSMFKGLLSFLLIL